MTILKWTTISLISILIMLIGSLFIFQYGYDKGFGTANYETANELADEYKSNTNETLLKICNNPTAFKIHPDNEHYYVCFNIKQLNPQLYRKLKIEEEQKGRKI